MPGVDELLGRIAHAPAESDFWQAAMDLGRTGARRAVRPLIHLARRTPESSRRRAILHALWLLDDPRATHLFLHTGRHGASEMARVIAVEGLGAAVHRPYVQRALADFLSAPSVAVRYSALCAAGCLRRGPVHPALRQALHRAQGDPASLYEEGDIARLAAHCAMLA